MATNDYTNTAYQHKMYADMVNRDDLFVYGNPITGVYVIPTVQKPEGALFADFYAFNSSKDDLEFRFKCVTFDDMGFEIIELSEWHKQRAKHITSQQQQ